MNLRNLLRVSVVCALVALNFAVWNPLGLVADETSTWGACYDCSPTLCVPSSIGGCNNHLDCYYF